MLYSNTINEILSNQNTGVEYEIALFYSLLCNDVERQKVSDAISERGDSEKIHSIISYTDKNIILDKLMNLDLNYWMSLLKHKMMQLVLQTLLCM